MDRLVPARDSPNDTLTSTVYSLVSTSAVAFAAALAVCGAAAPQHPPAPLLVVLTDTGAREQDLPVVARHPDPQMYIHELSRGFSGRLLRLYALAQRFARPDFSPQPAYLVLSNNQGGFPRTGFHFEGRPYPAADYIDLHKNGRLANRFGAINQIFPHELMHIIVRDLAGSPPDARDNQVHAIGVRTDRATAFGEGIAEHVQILAVEADGVAAETGALRNDATIRAFADGQLDAYRRALAARWSIAPKATMTFPLWFSANEQVLRYHAVRANRFAREPAAPRLLASRDLYHAYLLENILPGDADGPVKSAGRLLATEGIVSALFYRLATSERLQHAFRDDGFYRAFGVERQNVDPVDNFYLKLFAAIRGSRYDAADVLDAYTRLFPDEAEAVASIAADILHHQDIPRTPSLWMLNEDFQTGTSLFDQLRGLPRAHTFDLNAASTIDLLGVRGVTVEMATEIQRRTPLASVEALRDVSGLTPEVLSRFERMRKAYDVRVSTPDDGRTLSIQAVLYPFLWRAGIVAVVCAIVSALAYRTVRRIHWIRTIGNGLGAAVVGLLAGWIVEPSTALAFAAPVFIFGFPAAVVALWRTRSPRAAGAAVLAWAVAAVVPAIAVTPLF